MSEYYRCACAEDIKRLRGLLKEARYWLCGMTGQGNNPCADLARRIDVELQPKNCSHPNIVLSTTDPKLKPGQCVDCGALVGL